MKVYISVFDQYEEVVSVDIENNKVVTLFRGCLKNEYNIDEVQFVKEPEKEKCYLCRERDAVGKFLNEPCCRECVQSISFS